ncbi:MAG: S8 family serine peptidase [Actinomycetota bacterium]
MQMLGVSWDDSKKVTLGVSWDDSKKSRLLITLIAAALVAALATSPLTARTAHASAPSHRRVDVIVRKAPGSGHAAERATRAVGGSVRRRLPIIGGFTARVPAVAVDDLAASASVLSVTSDARVEMLHYVDGYDPEATVGSLYKTARFVDANDFWAEGHNGRGVDVALIDTGIVPVEGLGGPSKIINGPDLSFESQYPDLRYYDTYGHGTHMASIIAGRDPNLAPAEFAEQHDKFTGIAPGAQIVNVKVGDAEGATDVSQVIAAINWVVEHRRDDGLNIRVLNLSFGTDGVQDYALDPLSYAAGVAWRKGIVVVVAAGNRGFGTRALNNPALNPRLIAVGSNDTNGTEVTTDDAISGFSSVGTVARHPDLLAPGRSIHGLRNPGSLADVDYPGARVGARFFKGSGTSQSAAVVSGAAALILSQRPNISPDQVKRLLMSTAKPIPGADPIAQGAGFVDLKNLLAVPTPSAIESLQNIAPATGLGTLEGARGTNHLVSGGIELSGEQDIFGNPWDAVSWASAAINEITWTGGRFNGAQWAGDTWTGTSFASITWAPVAWTKNSWSGESWTKNSWSKNSWSGSSWTGDGWVKNSWSGGDWAKNSWSNSEWEKNSWSSAGWQ